MTADIAVLETSYEAHKAETFLENALNDVAYAEDALNSARTKERHLVDERDRVERRLHGAQGRVDYEDLGAAVLEVWKAEKILEIQVGRLSKAQDLASSARKVADLAERVRFCEEDLDHAAGLLKQATDRLAQLENTRPGDQHGLGAARNDLAQATKTHEIRLSQLAYAQWLLAEAQAPKAAA